MLRYFLQRSTFEEKENLISMSLNMQCISSRDGTTCLSYPKQSSAAEAAEDEDAHSAPFFFPLSAEITMHLPKVWILCAAKLWAF